jgi:DsbC/DsbD-like thiol-disulfide interchange protein
MSLKILRPLALVAIVTLAVCGELMAQAKKSDSVVKTTATADKPDAGGMQTVTVTMNMEKGWHTYANPVGNKDLIDTQTVVKVAAKEPVELVKLAYPEGKVQKDSVIGDYMIYEGTVTIKAQVKRAKGDTSPLDVSVTFQACSERGCLLPATVKISVP